MLAKRIADFGGEPSLDEVLRDPVVQAVMACDGVARDEIDELVELIQSRSEDEPCCQC